MANARAVIDVDINTSQAAAGLRNLQAQINAFNSTLTKSSAVQATAMRNAKDNLLELVNSSRFFTAETVKMQTAAAALDRTLSKGQVTLGQFFSAKFRKDAFAAAEVMSLANARASALQTQFVATGAAANGFRDAIAIRPLQAFNDTAVVSAQKLAIQRAMLNQATTSMINFGKNTQWAGRQLMVGFTVPLTIFGGLAGKTFMELEKEAVNFKKVYGDAFTPPEEMEANLKAVQQLGEEYTKYGIAVKDTVGLAAQAAAAGAKNQDLLDATAQSTRLATLGQMEQNQALETTISLQNAFRLSGDELAKSINFLNMVENQTVVTLQDLSAAIPRVAPVIQGLGGTVEDLAAMLAAMQEGGVSAEQGANALKSGLASLINPTDRAKEKLQELGISLDAIIQANRGDLMGTIQAFSRALSSIDEFSRQQALEQVFGKFQYARLGALFDNITRSGSQASRVLEVAAMSSGEMAASAEKELRAIEESVGTKLTAAMERLKLAIAPIGELFVKMATPIINFLAGIAEGFNNLPDGAKKFLGIATVITGLVIPAGTMFLGLLMNLLGTLVKFGNIVGLAFKGFISGGFKGAFDNVSQALRYMSLSEIDAANSAQQLAGTTEAVNTALRNQVGASEIAQAAVNELTYAYSVLRAQMLEAAEAQAMVFGVGAAAMGAAGRRGARGPRRRGFNKGGNVVPGTGSRDTVPAILTPGEFVVNKKATKENFALLEAINGGKVAALNNGSINAVKQAHEAGAGTTPLVPGIETRVRTSTPTPQSDYKTLADMPDELVRRINREAKNIVGEGLIQDFGFGVATIPQSLNNQLRRGQASTSSVIAQFMRNQPLKEIFDYIGGSSSVRRRVEQEVVSQLEQMMKNGKTTLGDSDFETVVTQAFERQGKSELKKITDLGYGTSRATFTTGSGAMTAAAKLNVKGERGYHGLYKTLAQNLGFEFDKGRHQGRSAYFLRNPETGETYAISPGRTPRTGADYQVLPTRGRGSALAHFLRPRVRFNKGGMSKGGRGGVPAMLTPGEYIVSKDAAKNNLPLLQAINSGKIQGFAEGGEVIGYEYGSARPITDPEEAKYLARTGAGIYVNERDARSGRNAMDSRTIGRKIGRAIAVRRQTRASRPSLGQRYTGAVRGGVGRMTGMGAMRGMGMGMGMGMAGGAMMMASSMMPNQGAATAMNVGGAALSMASMIPTLLPMLGGVAPALAAIAPVALPLVAVVGAATAALVIWRKNVDESARAAADLASNAGVTANALNTMAELFGQQTPAQRAAQLQLGVSAEEQAVMQSAEFQNIFASEQGQKFIQDLKDATSAERFQKLSDYLKAAIASGIMDQTQASAFAKAIASQIGDVTLGTSTATAIREQKTGAKAMLELAQQRMAAVPIVPTGGGRIGSDQASAAIGGAIQVVQDFANAEALAREQFAQGTITYDEMQNVINQAREAQSKYTTVIQEAMDKTSDFGATMQATKDQLIDANLISEEGFAALEAASKRTVASGAVVGGRGVVAGRGAGVRVLDEDLLGAATSAIAGGMNADIATQIAESISSGEGLIADAYKKALEKGMSAQEAFGLSGATEQLLGEGGLLSGVTIGRGKTGAARARTAASTVLSDFVTGGGDEAQLTSFLGGVSVENRGEMIKTLLGLDQEGKTRMIADAQVLAQNIGQTMTEKLQMSNVYEKALTAPGGTQGITSAIERATEAGVTENVIEYAITTTENGEPIDFQKKMNELTSATENIASLPDEMIKGLGIDITLPQDLEKFGPMVDSLKQNWPIIENLNPNINMTASMKFLTMGNDGKMLPPEQVSKNVTLLNAAWTNLSSKNKNTRLQAIRQLIISTQDAEGNTLDPDQVDSAYNELVEKFGGKVMDLPPDVLNKLVSLQVEVEGIDAAIAATKAEMAMGGSDARLENLAQRLADLQSAKIALGEAQKTTVSAAPKTTGAGGGGGEKPIGKQLQEEAKMLQGFAKAFSSKKGQQMMAGPFGPEFLEYLKGQGEKGLKIFKENGEKLKAAFADFKKARKAEEQIAFSALPAQNIQLQKEINQRKQLNSIVTQYAKNQGISFDVSKAAFDALSQQEKDIILRAEAGKKVNQENLEAAKQKLKLNTQNAQLDIAEQQQSYVRGVQEEFQLTQRLQGLGYRQEEIDALKSIPGLQQMSNAEVEQYAQLLRTARDERELENIAIQDTVNVLNIMSGVLSQAADNFDRMNIKPLRDSIDSINDSIDALDRSKEGHQDLIESYEKQKDAQDEIIDGYEKEKDKIQEVFDERISALEKIENINERIARQQRGQLDIASALSRGDIAGAAQATLSYQQEQAAMRIQDAKDALEAQREAEIGVIDEKVKAVNEEILRIDELIKIERDKIAGIDDQIDAKRKSIRDVNDQIKAQELEKEKIMERQRKIQAAINYLQIEQQINTLDKAAPGYQQSVTLLQQQQSLLAQSVGGPAALAEFGISATPTPGLDIAKMAADLQLAISPAQQLNALLSSLALNPQVAQAFKMITDNMVNGVLPNIDAVMAKAAELEIDPAVADEAYRIATEFVTVANTADESNKNMVAMLTDAQQVNGVIGGINAIIAALNQQAAAAANANRVRRQELEEAAAVAAAGFYSGTPAASTTQGGKTPPKKTEPAKGKGKDGKGKGKNKAFGGIISRAFGGMINYKGSTEAAPGMMYGGKMKKYAYGSFVPGIGMTDRVPAMLTPGEFVVRKSVAAEYGPLLSALNSNVFPKMNNIGAMPKSSTNVKDGIQYNYDIDVNVAGTNASPDEIAQAVMYRIKRIDDRQVRGTKIG